MTTAAEFANEAQLQRKTACLISARRLLLEFSKASCRSSTAAAFASSELTPAGATDKPEHPRRRDWRTLDTSRMFRPRGPYWIRLRRILHSHPSRHYHPSRCRPLCHRILRYHHYRPSRRCHHSRPSRRYRLGCLRCRQKSRRRMAHREERSLPRPLQFRWRVPEQKRKARNT